MPEGGRLDLRTPNVKEPLGVAWDHIQRGNMRPLATLTRGSKTRRTAPP
jgi:hypothetical protein